MIDPTRHRGRRTNVVADGPDVGRPAAARYFQPCHQGDELILTAGRINRRNDSHLDIGVCRGLRRLHRLDGLWLVVFDDDGAVGGT
jgi:hypothetical protein